MKMFGIHACKIEKLQAQARNDWILEIALRVHFRGLDNASKNLKKWETGRGQGVHIHRSCSVGGICTKLGSLR